ncbi:MAG TPA: NfeD family protein [Devosia sp.]|nr:NfeD family protein [Devosia sp.]
MVLLNLFATYGPWAWFVVGLVLLALELVVPGGYFLWLGAAGLATGILAFIPGITWPWQFTVFGVLALAIVIGWTLITRNRRPKSDNPFLNRRAERFIGHEAVIEEPIKDGFGRLALGDGVWRIAGPDLPAGRKVRVVGADGAVLKVEAVS